MHRFKNILCPVDFSESSYEAIEKASFLAQLFQADLTLLHVINVLPQSFGVVFGLDLSSSKMMEKATQNARTLLREAKKKYVPYAVKCKSSIRVGRASEQIIREAEELGSELIVIASKGPGENETPFMGANTNQVISGAPCPVITYNQIEKNSGSNPKGFRNILIPIDLKEDFSEIRAYICEHFSRMGPAVTIISVVPVGSSKEEIDEAVKNVEIEAEILSDHGIHQVHNLIIEDDNPAQQIIKYGKEKGSDLIMMSTHGKSGLGNMVIGTVTANVINHAIFPVFTIRPGIKIPSANGTNQGKSEIAVEQQGEA
ncbi:MAG: universal stress protein [Bacteroidetes bacterium]|nr:universal stress protein [Bacteroidota bacterium]